MAIQRQYILTYTLDTAQAIVNAKALAAEINTLNHAAGMATGTVKNLANAYNTMTNSVNKANASMQASSTHISSTTSVMMGLSSSLYVFQVGLDILRNFGEAANASRKHVEELGEEMRKLRPEFRELAALQGKAGPDNTVIAKPIQMAVAAGVTAKEARDFMMHAQAGSKVGKEKGHITDKVDLEAATEGLKFGNRNNLTGATSGDLVGAISQYHEIPSAEASQAIAEKTIRGVSPGKGSAEDKIAETVKLASQTMREDGKGPVQKLEHLAAMMGVMGTHMEPGKAHNAIDTSIKSLRDFKNRKKGGFLSRLGITPDLNHMQALEKIAPIIKEADENGMGGDVALGRMGFNDQEAAATALMARNLEKIKQTITDQDEEVSGKISIEKNNSFLNTTTGQSMKIKAQTEANDLVKGMRMERLKAAKEAAGIYMEKNGKLSGGKNQAGAAFLDLFGLRTDVFKEEKAVEIYKVAHAFKKAQNDLINDRMKRGMTEDEAKRSMESDFPESFKIGGGDKWSRDKKGELDLNNVYMRNLESKQSQADAFNRLLEAAEQQGVPGYIDNSAPINKNLQALANQTEKTEAIRAAGGNNFPKQNIGGMKGIAGALAGKGKVNIGGMQALAAAMGLGPAGGQGGAALAPAAGQVGGANANAGVEAKITIMIGELQKSNDHLAKLLEKAHPGETPNDHLRRIRANIQFDEAIKASVQPAR